MDSIDLIKILISVISLIVPLLGTIAMFFKNKDEYVKLKIEKRRVVESIRIINDNSAVSLSDKDTNSLTNDDYRMTLYQYCHFIGDKLSEFYPRCHFSISIKLVLKDAVSTVLTTGDELFINNNVQQVVGNSEYEAILKNGFDYFFVTDLHTFDEKKQKYITSDPEWRYKYNTSIVFPVKSVNNDKNNVIGFICINSPQTLRKMEKNNLIIKLIENTSGSIAKNLLNCIN